MISAAEQCGAEEIWLNCRDARSLAAGTTDAVKLARFFDKVIEKKTTHHREGGCSSYTTQTSGSAASSFAGGQMTDRRRHANSLPYTSPETPLLLNSPIPIVSSTPKTTINSNLLLESAL